MSGAAAGAAGPADQGREVNTPQVRDRCFNLNPARFTELCEGAYMTGDYSYVIVALRAEHEGMREFIDRQSAVE